MPAPAPVYQAYYAPNQPARSTPESAHPPAFAAPAIQPANYTVEAAPPTPAGVKLITLPQSISQPAEPSPSANKFPPTPSKIPLLETAPMVDRFPPAPAKMPLAIVMEPVAPMPVEEELPRGPASAFRGGVGFYYLKPTFDTNPAFARSTNLPTPRTVTTSTSQENFHWDMHGAPLFWLEYIFRDTLGVRVRYFHFDSSPTTVSVANPFPVGATTTQGPGATRKRPVHAWDRLLSA